MAHRRCHESDECKHQDQKGTTSQHHEKSLIPFRGKNKSVGQAVTARHPSVLSCDPGREAYAAGGLAVFVQIDSLSSPRVGDAHSSKQLVKIGAKVVRHGRYITFQMAEVAVSRALLAGILRLIDGLRPTPLPP